MPATRFVKAHLYVDWSRADSYVDETDRLVSASGNWRRNNPEDSITSPRGIVAQATITLINHDQRFSTLNEDGALYASIGNGGYYQVPMYITVEENLTEVRIFTGIIKGPRETGGSTESIGQITFDCRGREELLLQKKLSTTQANVAGYNAAGLSEAGVILEWLTLSSIDTADFVHDAGKFIIEWAWLDNESPLEDIWQLAAAGGGAFYTNPAGKFVYESMSNWLPALAGASYEEFTDDDYKRGTIRINDDELYKTIIVEVASRTVASSAVLWDSPEQVILRPATTTTIVANFQQPIYALEAILYDPSSVGGWPMGAYVTLDGWVAYAQRMEMTFTNTSTGHATLLRNFQVLGKALTGGPSNEVTLDATASFWTDRAGRTRTLSNQYVQTQAHGEALCAFLRARHQLPRVFYTLSDVPGDAGRALSQRIIIRAGGLVSDDRTAIVTGLAWRWGRDGGFTQSIEAFDAVDLFTYAPTVRSGDFLAATEYFVIGTNELDDGNRVFY
jgi:hypothetical protein